MSVERVNVLNIGLMLASCAAAWMVPFELFLLAYALLGPLHYLTEIPWLHQRDYFASRRRDAWGLFALCGLFLLLKSGGERFEMAFWAPVLNATALGVAGAIVFCRSRLARGAVIAMALVMGLAVWDTPQGHDWLRIFLPTLIHVSVFTGAFMLFGALKGRSLSGLVSVAVFGACVASFFLGPRAALPAPPGAYVVANYNTFAAVNISLVELFQLGSLKTMTDLFQSEAGITVMRLIAFAYTYHYLNWFSKTSVIRWHEIPRSWGVAIVALWLTSVGIYLYDYRSGLLALFALSFLHVYLEFPLNHRSFAGIGTELNAIARHGWKRT